MADDTDNAPSFSIQRLYLKDLSLEQPNSPGVLLEQGQPAVEIMLNTRYIADLVEKGELSAIKEAMDKSLSPGSQSFEQALLQMVQAGLVSEVAVEGRAARFDATGVQHHHFICERCGKVEDMEWYDVPLPASDSLGKRILLQCEVNFRGLCAKCASRSGSRRVS